MVPTASTAARSATPAVSNSVRLGGPGSCRAADGQTGGTWVSIGGDGDAAGSPWAFGGGSPRGAEG